MPTGDLTPAQRTFLDHLIGSEFADTFYLSGGTALSAFHLHHRDSEDLDLFSRRVQSEWHLPPTPDVVSARCPASSGFEDVARLTAPVRRTR